MTTYRNRRNKIINSGPLTESNGCMMRCSPIALIENFQRRRDISLCGRDITNPALICKLANIIYIEILHNFLYKKECDVPKIISSLRQEENNFLIDQFIVLWNESQQPNWNTRVISGKDKGWIMHALYCAFVAVTFDQSFISFMKLLVEMGGDTDTNR